MLFFVHGVGFLSPEKSTCTTSRKMPASVTRGRMCGENVLHTNRMSGAGDAGNSLRHTESYVSIWPTFDGVVRRFTSTMLGCVPFHATASMRSCVFITACLRTSGE